MYRISERKSDDKLRIEELTKELELTKKKLKSFTKKQSQALGSAKNAAKLVSAFALLTWIGYLIFKLLSIFRISEGISVGMTSTWLALTIIPFIVYCINYTDFY